jgi:hypothetical protein
MEAFVCKDEDQSDRLFCELALATTQFPFQHRRTLEGHDPPLGQHQPLACPRVSAPSLSFVFHAELPEAAHQHFLAAHERLLDDLKGASTALADAG